MPTDIKKAEAAVSVALDELRAAQAWLAAARRMERVAGRILASDATLDDKIEYLHDEGYSYDESIELCES